MAAKAGQLPVECSLPHDKLEEPAIGTDADAVLATHGGIAWRKVRDYLKLIFYFLCSYRLLLLIVTNIDTHVFSLPSRGPEDEHYIRVILETAANEHCETAGNPRLCIMDARAYTSAVANGYIGGGRENASKLTLILVALLGRFDMNL